MIKNEFENDKKVTQISKHFNTEIDKIACQCGCGQEIIQYDLFEIIEDFREFIGDKPINVHCVNRCKEHNKRIGGAKNSYHVEGGAMDLHAIDLDMEELHRLAIQFQKEYNKDIGLGLYDWGIHIDPSYNHNRKRFWDFRKK